MEKKTSRKAPAKKATPAAKKKKAAAPEVQAAGSSKKQVKTRAKRMGDKACKMTGCKRAYRAKGYCRSHYREWRHGKFGKARYTACHDYGCAKPMAQNRHGYCEDHYQNFYIKGIAPTHAPVAEKPAAKPEKTEAA